jgi:2-dehydropantoate 2-reductase
MTVHRLGLIATLFSIVALSQPLGLYVSDDRPGRLNAWERAQLLNEGSIGSPAVSRISQAIWSKLMTNMSMSVLCLITRQTARGARRQPSLRDVVPHLLEEAQAIGQSCYA